MSESESDPEVPRELRDADRRQGEYLAWVRERTPVEPGFFASGTVGDFRSE